MKVPNLLTPKEIFYIIIGSHIFAFVWVFTHSIYVMNTGFSLHSILFHAVLNKSISPLLYLICAMLLQFGVIYILSFISAIPVSFLQIVLKPVRINRCAIIMSILLIGLAYFTGKWNLYIGTIFISEIANAALGLWVWGIFITIGIIATHQFNQNIQTRTKRIRNA